MIAIIESRKFDSNVSSVLTIVHGMMLKMVLNKCSYKLRFTIPAQLSLIVGVEKSEQRLVTLEGVELTGMDMVNWLPALAKFEPALSLIS